MVTPWSPAMPVHLLVCARCWYITCAETYCSVTVASSSGQGHAGTSFPEHGEPFARFEEQPGTASSSAQLVSSASADVVATLLEMLSILANHKSQENACIPVFREHGVQSSVSSVADAFRAYVLHVTAGRCNTHGDEAPVGCAAVMAQFPNGRPLHEAISQRLLSVLQTSVVPLPEVTWLVQLIAGASVAAAEVHHRRDLVSRLAVCLRVTDVSSLETFMEKME